VTTAGPSSLPSLDTLLKGLIEGDRRSLAQTLSIIERGGDQADATLRRIAAMRSHDATPSATLGVTGPPGSGKSTLVDALVAHRGAHGDRIAVVAVDPSSPLTGGAILGDRVRLRPANSSADNVYMRSIAARGSLGGLATMVPGALRVIEAAGWPTVIIETVGVGQSEVAVAAQADTTVVVVNPDSGDEVQANKAGLLEMADVFVVNKSDREGASRTLKELHAMLHFGAKREWTVPVLRTTATEDEGIVEVWSAIDDHRRYLETSGEGRRRNVERLRAEIDQRIAAQLRARVLTLERSDEGRAVYDQVEQGLLDPVSAAVRLLATLGL